MATRGRRYLSVTLETLLDDPQLLRHAPAPTATGVYHLETLNLETILMNSHKVSFAEPHRLWQAVLTGGVRQKACRDDFSVLYKRVPRMFAELETGRADGRYPRLFRALTKANLLILDDWGPDRLSADQRRDLMEIVEDRYQNAAILITSQLPVDKWHDVIGEPTFADAILDRIVHNAHRINLDGPSMRKTIAENFNANDVDHAERK